MHGKDGTDCDILGNRICRRRFRILQKLSNRARVNQIGFRIRLHRNRYQSIVAHCQDAGDVGVGRNNHTIATLQISHLNPCTQHQTQRVQSIGTSYAMTCTIIVGPFLLEGRDPLPEQIPARVNHIEQRLLDVCLVGSIDGM